MSCDMTVQGLEQARALPHRGSGAHRHLLTRSHDSTLAAGGCQVNVPEAIQEYPEERSWLAFAQASVSSAAVPPASPSVSSWPSVAPTCWCSKVTRTSSANF